MNLKFRIGLLLLGLLLPGICTASAIPDSVSIGHEILSNGLEVFIRSLPRQPLVSTGVFYSAGSAQDPPGLEGLAHLVEHMLFISSSEFPDGGLGRRIDLYCARRNASTSPFLLETKNSCLPQFLPEVLSVEAARMGRLTPAVADFERERSVVQEEIAMRDRSTPFNDLITEIYRAGYKGHPRGRRVAGTKESVGRITLDDVHRFAADQLRPGNAALVINGSLDIEKTLAMVREHFGTITDDRPDEHSPYLAAPFVQPPTVLLDRSDFTGFKLALGFRLPRGSVEEIALLEFYSTLFKTASLTSRLWMMPEDNMLFLGSGFQYHRPPPPRSDSNIGYRLEPFDPEADSRRALNFIWRNVHEIVNRLADEEDFIKARDLVLRSLAGGFRRQDATTSRIGKAALAGNALLSPEQILAEIEKLDKQTCLRFLDRWIIPERAITGVCHGADSERQIGIDMARSSRAADNSPVDDPMDTVTSEEYARILSAYQSSELFTIQRLELDNGIPVFFRPQPGTQTARLAGVVRYPLLKDERAGKKRGIGLMYNRVVNAGYRSPRKSSRPLTDPTGVSRPFGATFTCYPDHLEFKASGSAELFSVMGHILVKRFDSKDFNLSKWRSALQRAKRSFPPRDAWQVTPRQYRLGTLLGENHPLLGMVNGEQKTAQKITYKNLQKFHMGLTGQRDMALVVVGDIDTETLLQALQPSFGTRRDHKPVSVDAPPPDRLTSVQGKVISGFEMSDVRLVLTFPPRRIGEAGEIPVATLNLLTEILRTRLKSTLRTNTGLNYTVRVTEVSCGGCALAEIATSCQLGHTPEVFAKLHQELRHLSEIGLSEREVQRAKLNLVRRLTARFADADDTFLLIRRLARWGEVPQNILSEILAVSTDEVNELLPRYAPADRFVFTATGPIFEEDIEQFDLGGK